MKEINRVPITVEHFNGDSYMSFILSIKEDGSVEILDTKDCSLADKDGDYIFGSDNELYRVQADEPILHSTFDEIWDSYHKISKVD